MTTTQQPVGAPVWFELATTDQVASSRFHRQLFGWTPVDHPMGEGGSVYTIFEHGGREVGACYTMMEAERAQGVPSHWAVYFRVDDCDAAVARAVELGATVVAPPFDIEDLLRMSVLTDPTGAYLCLMQLRAHAGVGAIHEVGTVGWVELATPDLERASAFYTALFAWTLAEHAGTPTPYRIFSVDGRPQGGMMQMDEAWAGIPPHWGIYIRVADVDATVAQATALGGSVCVPAFDAPGVGRIARIDDPTGGGAYVITMASG